MSTNFKKASSNSKPLDPLYDKKLTCMYCERVFTSKQVRTSKTRVVKQDSDYCTYYEGENPIFYEAFVCPYCGFAFTKSFSPLSPGKRDIIEKDYIRKLKNVPNLCGKRTYEEAIRALKLAALSSYLKGENDSITGNLFLRIAWLYRYVEETEKERIMMEKALRFYEQAYQKGDSRQSVISEHQLLYLMGYLHTRLDHYEEAAKIFSRLFSDRSVPPKIRARATETWNKYKNTADKLNDTLQQKE